MHKPEINCIVVEQHMKLHKPFPLSDSTKVCAEIETYANQCKYFRTEYAK